MVEAPSAELRAGPGGHHRLLGRSRKGEVLEVTGRDAGRRYYRVRLPDGRIGFVLADEVALREEERGGFWAFLGDTVGSVFARGSFPEHALELSLLGGLASVRDEVSGVFGGRLAYLADGRAGVELTVSEAPLSTGSLLLVGGGFLAQLAPDGWAIPYATVGAGLAHGSASADAPLGEASDRALAYGAAGLKLALRQAVTLRLEARQDLVLSPDGLLGLPGASAGLALHF